MGAPYGRCVRLARVSHQYSQNLHALEIFRQNEAAGTVSVEGKLTDGPQLKRGYVHLIRNAD